MNFRVFRVSEESAFMRTNRIQKVINECIGLFSPVESGSLPMSRLVSRPLAAPT
jgi:hypothetical protein